MSKKWFYRLMRGLCLTIALALPISVLAEEKEFDMEHPCTISVEIEWSGQQPVKEKTMAIYQVGEVDQESQSLGFVLTEAFIKSGADLSAASSEEVRVSIEKLKETARGLKPLAIGDFDRQGRCSFHVTPGVYLICQTDDDKMPDIQASLISVPTVDETLQGWVYEVEAKPKARWEKENVETGDRSDWRPWLALALGCGLLIAALRWIKFRVKTLA